MRVFATILIAVSLVMLPGCDNTTGTEVIDVGEEEQMLNTGIVELHRESAAEQAVIRQQTLFPYHFIENGAALTEVGHRDVSVLARHYQKYPGTLSIRRGVESENLYQERVSAVLNTLVEAGVDTSRVAVEDGLPRGDGQSTEWALTIRGRADGTPKNYGRDRSDISTSNY